MRFALIAACFLGFALTAAVGNLIQPLAKVLFPPEEPPGGKLDKKIKSAVSGPEEPPEPSRPKGLAAVGGLCFALGTLTAVGVGWTAACVIQPELLGDESQMNTRLLIGLAGGFLFGGVGLAEDLARLRPGRVLGLRRGPRLALESAAAVLVLVMLFASDCMPTGAALPGLGYCSFGPAAPVLWFGVLLALAESARWSGEADGVLCGAGFVMTLGLIGVLGQLGYLPLAVLPAALAGSLLAFLLWNFPPARMLPGAAGCLFVAGAVGCIPLSVGRPLLGAVLGLPFLAEGGMVLLQVLWHKLTGKPLFSTAPLSRWLQKREMSGPNIFYLFCALALGALVLALGFARG